jgi:hypothetical protein
MAEKVRVVLNPAAIYQEINGPGGPGVRALFERGEKVKKLAIQFAPRVTGNLANHIVKRLVERRGKPVMLVGVENVPYAIYVHEGAQPHQIRPKKAPFLVFEVADGTVVFTTLVNHPGNAPNRFLIRAANASR